MSIKYTTVLLNIVEDEAIYGAYFDEVGEYGWNDTERVIFFDLAEIRGGASLHEARTHNELFNKLLTFIEKNKLPRGGAECWIIKEPKS